MPRKKKRSADDSVAQKHEDGLVINEEYAKNLERRKRSEELHRAKSLGINLDVEEQDLESSSSESEDENAALLTKGIDRKIRDTLEAISKKDSRIYDPDAKFFENPEDEENTEDNDSDTSEADPVAGWENVSGNTQPTMTIKDYVRKEILETGKLEGSSSSDESDAGQTTGRKQRTVYDEEQKGIQDSLRNATTADDEESEESEDDFFKVKEKSEVEKEVEEKEFDKFILERSKKLGKERGEEYLLHSYLEKETTDEKERFLRDFVLSNGWLDKNKGGPPDATLYNLEVDEGGEKVEDEEEFLEQQDKVERAHNFRFEEDGAKNIVSYARKREGSVRRKDETRKKQRELKQQKKQEKKEEQLEEIKRLKNLKRAEIDDKLNTLRTTSGGLDFHDIDLDEDFDPDKYSAQMAAKFGDEYYDEDQDITEHPFKSDPLNYEVDGGDEAMETGAADPEGDLKALVDEYYDIDAKKFDKEKMKFRYREVEAETYGMSMEEILSLEEKELNRRMPLKKLAAYRQNSKKRNGKKHNGKKRLDSSSSRDGRIEKKDKRKEKRKEKRSVEGDDTEKKKRRKKKSSSSQMSEARRKAFSS